MAKASDLESMSIKELRELKDRIESIIPEKERAERQELKRKMAELAAEAGLSLEDVLGGSGKGSRGKVAVKYRNPEDATQTWTGRGRQPKWLVEKLAKRGVKIEDFAV